MEVTKRLPARRRAISNIISTILLIVITISAIGGMYSFYSTTVSRVQATGQFTVSADLAAGTSGGSSAIAAVTVSNSGTIAITALVLSGGIAPASVTWSPAVSSSNPLAPGSSTSTAFTPSGTIVAGEAYSVTITVTFANGATSNQVATLTAH